MQGLFELAAKTYQAPAHKRRTPVTDTMDFDGDFGPFGSAAQVRGILAASSPSPASCFAWQVTLSSRLSSHPPTLCDLAAEHCELDYSWLTWLAMATDSGEEFYQWRPTRCAFLQAGRA